jgi:glycosyltransferase involved in cell wall biosynthesis
MIRASVIIPVYNGERTITAAINSCLNQTVPVHEIIIVDDASTDATVTVVEELQVQNLRLIRNTTNVGPAVSRNRGMDTATGDWIFFLDADDQFHPEKVNYIHHILSQHTKIRAMGHGFTCEEKEIVLPAITALPAPVPCSVRTVLLRNPVVTPALCVASENATRFSASMRFAEDHDFCLRTTEAYGLYKIDLPLCRLGRKPLSRGGISANRWFMRKGEMQLYRDFCRRRKMQWLIPFLLLFSLIKHGKNFLVNS